MFNIITLYEEFVNRKRKFFEICIDFFTVLVYYVYG